MKEIVSDKIKEYAKIKNRLHFVNILFIISILLIFLLSGLSHLIKYLISYQVNNFYIIISLYFLAFSVSFYVIGLPLDYYEGYIIEHRFNLSNQTKLSWLKESIKKTSVSLILGLIVVEILYLFLKNYPDFWWALAALFWFLLTVVLAKVAPLILIPIFYKQTPLENKELKDKLISLCKKVNEKVKGVYEIDMSKQTKKANAALVGSGGTRRILLSDTLLGDYTPDEIEVVLAHELGHHALKHLPKLLTFGGLVSFIGFYVTYLTLNHLVVFFNLEGIDDIAGFPILMLFLSLFSLTIMPLQNALSRSLEKEADIFALKKTKLYDAFISAMEKLTRQNLSDPNPSKFIEIILYDHPPVLQRISLANSLKDKENI